MARSTEPTPARPTPAQIAADINAMLKGDVMQLGNDPRYVVEYLPSGVMPFDLLLQGGLARGRMIELYGTWSSLKSLIGYSAIATSQAAGLTTALLDTEHAFDPEWATQCGVNVKEMIGSRPVSGEEAFDVAEALIRSGVDLLVLDSVATLLPESEREKGMAGEKTQPGRLAQLMSRGLRKITAANSRTAILFINQVRMNIGVTFGNPEQAAGGKALPFYASQRINMKKTGKVTEDSQLWDGTAWKPTKLQIAQRFSAQLEKSKLNAPQREMHFTWDYRSSRIDEPAFLVAQGMEIGLIDKRGNTWEYETVKAVGRDKFVAGLAGNQQAMESLQTKVYQHHKMPLSSYRGAVAAPKSVVAKPKVVKRAASAPASTLAAVPAASDTTPATE